MLYLESSSTDPHFNLALEQYVFDKMDPSQEYFMLWQNDNAIIVGKYQNTVSEINLDYVRSRGIRVVRRLSGGGAVYHDLGNLNFTFIVNGGKAGALDFNMFCGPVAQALQKLGVNAQINGRNDITIDGKKFSGNSQYIKNGRIMHHGTILFDSDLDTVANSLMVSADKIESKGVASVRSRVTNVKEHLSADISVREFKELLLLYMFANQPIKRIELTESDILCVREIQKQRYDTWEWNFGASPRYRIHKERRVPNCGKIELYMEVGNGKITDLLFFGDFFGSGDVKDVAEAVIGCSVREDELGSALSGIDIGQYFNNLSREQLVQIILQ